MKRRLLNLLTALSLVLCVAVVALWVRGYFAPDQFGWTVPRADGGRRSIWVTSGRGGVGVSAWTLPPGVIRSSGPFLHRGHDQYGGARWAEFGWGGFGFYAWGMAPPADDVRAAGFCVPAPVAVLATAVMPALYVRRRGRHRPGQCPRCGYDLRATPDRCPECGAAQEEGGGP